MSKEEEKEREKGKGRKCPFLRAKVVLRKVGFPRQNTGI
jgi:hypothetical protein